MGRRWGLAAPAKEEPKPVDKIEKFRGTNPFAPVSNKQPAQVNFAPSFVVTKQPKVQDHVDDGGFSQPTTPPPEETATAPISPPRSRRRVNGGGKSQHGILARRLANAIACRANDALRLRNPAFCQGAFDMNDPRKRASTVLDLTIVGNLIPSGTRKNSTDGKYNAACYIHRQATATDNRLTAHPAFAWASFLPTSIRTLGIRRGTSLRVYDAIVITPRGVGTDGSLVDGKTKPGCCWPVVARTDLCELYPGTLEPLPEVPAFESCP